MFGVGIHFSLDDLLSVRRIAPPGAAVQIATATFLGAAVSRLWGWSRGSGIVLGLCLSVASTVAHARSKAVKETAHAFFAELTVADLLAPGSQDEGARSLAAETSPESATEQVASASGPVIPRIADNPRANAPEIR